jgi:hypothetical protein
MNGSRFWLIWPDSPALSLLVIALLAMAFLYAARRPMHQLIRAAGHAVGGPLRIASRWLLAAATEINDRNKAVLLAHGRQEMEKRVEREFERIATLVNRDLQGYPALQRKLADEVTTIEEDYKKCGEVPPPPPDWVEAVAAIGKIKSGGGELAMSILEGINESIIRIHDKAIAEYRKSYETRHAILEKIMPCWRAIEKTLSQVDRNISGLLDSASSVDNLMAQYEQIVAKTDKAVHALTVSALTQFGIALLVMLVAIGGTFINFKLIALPMSEMVGAADYITASLRTSEVAALVIILVEASMGLFLMETMRITRLFPVIGNLSDRARRRMMWVALSLLVTLAGIEAALALMRDMLIQDKQALVQSLASVQQAAIADSWVGKIPTVGQMLLGFILPFALTFVAIPLESLIHSTRTMGGALLMVLARGFAMLLRIAGNLVRQASRVLVHLYDVTIVLPLWVERVAVSARDVSVRGDASPISLQPREET